jgi:hypothetical protein
LHVIQPKVQETALVEVKTGPIAEVSAAILRCAASFTDASRGELANVVVEPAGDGQVVVMAAGPHSAVRIEGEGSAAERVLLPGLVVSKMAKRHPEATLFSVRQVDEVLVSLRSYSEDSTLAVSAPAGQSCFAQFPPLDEPEALEAKPLRMEPRLLIRALSALAGADTTQLSQLSYGVRITAAWPTWTATAIVAGMTG